MIEITGVITKHKYSVHFDQVKGVAKMFKTETDDARYPNTYTRVVLKEPIELTTDGKLYECIDTEETIAQLNAKISRK